MPLTPAQKRRRAQWTMYAAAMMASGSGSRETAPDGALITRAGDYILDRAGDYIVETR